jgi:hypothetical protein
VPEYMLLLYAPEVGEAEWAQRWAELPLWDEVNASLRQAGVLVRHAPLDCEEFDQAVGHAFRLEIPRPDRSADGS